MVKRKSFLPTFLIALVFWFIWGFTLLRISPASLFSFFIFIFSFFMALFLTLSLVLANSRRGFLISAGIVVLLFLRLLKIAHFLNLFLLVGALVALELYLGKR